MTRRKKTDTPDPPSDTNGNVAEDVPPSPPPENRKPVMSWRYPTDRSTTIEVAVWPNRITLQSGEPVEVYGVTFQRSYKDAEGNWQKNSSYRGHDLPVLLHALQQAHGWILDRRELNHSF